MAAVGVIGVPLPMGGIATRVVTVENLRYACRLELDINTPGDYADEIPREGLGKVFEELVTFGVEIAKRGDIP
ncbi:MAG: hypothetical protein Q8O40_11575 [Chloroflexota bacterium]|nr:hypothetical protein [Chloroflexota bacterium]